MSESPPNISIVRVKFGRHITCLPVNCGNQENLHVGGLGNSTNLAIIPSCRQNHKSIIDPIISICRAFAHPVQIPSLAKSEFSNARPSLGGKAPLESVIPSATKVITPFESNCGSADKSEIGSPNDIYNYCQCFSMIVCVLWSLFIAPMVVFGDDLAFFEVANVDFGGYWRSAERTGAFFTDFGWEPKFKPNLDQILGGGREIIAFSCWMTIVVATYVQLHSAPEL